MDFISSFKFLKMDSKGYCDPLFSWNIEVFQTGVKALLFFFPDNFISDLTV